MKSERARRDDDMDEHGKAREGQLLSTVENRKASHSSVWLEKIRRTGKMR